MKLLKGLLKWTVGSIAIMAVIAGVYLTQAYVIDRKDNKNDSSEVASANGKSSSNGKNGSSGTGKNGSTGTGSNGAGEGEDYLNDIGNELGELADGTNILPINGANGSTNGSGSNGSNNGEGGSNSNGGILNSDTASSIGDKAKSLGQKAWSTAKKAWNISVDSFKEGYNSVPDYNSYNFDDRFLFYEGTQYEGAVINIINMLIKNSDDDFYSKPTLTLRNFGGNRSIEFTTSEEYKAQLEDVKSLITPGNYDVSFGYTRFYIYADEIIITK